MGQRGFTLLELMLVVAVLVVLAAMALPVFTGSLSSRQLRESAEQVRSLLYLVSAEAKQAGRRMELRFVDPPAASYLAGGETSGAARSVEVRIERDPRGASGVFEQIQADWARWSVAGPQVQIVSVEASEPLPDPGADESSDGEAVGPPVIIFGPDGRSQVGDVVITLMNERLDGFRVHLRGATGLAVIEPLPPPTTE